MGRVPSLLAPLVLALASTAAGGQAPPAPADPAPAVYTSVRITGHAGFTEEQLLQAAEVPRAPRFRFLGAGPAFTAVDVSRAAAEIALFYHRQGFFEATAVRTESPPPEAEIHVEEGLPTLCESVLARMAEPGSGEEEALLSLLLEDLPLRQGDRFTSDAYEASATHLARGFQEAGHPFPEIFPDAEVDLGSRKARAFFTVTPGPRGVFGEVAFRGLRHAEEALLARAVTFHRGSPYRISEVEKTQEALYRTGLFDSVVVRPRRKGPEGEVPVVIVVKEGRHRRIRLGVGFSTDEDLRWRAGWETLRLRDRMITLGVELRTSSLEREASAHLRRPYFLDRNTALSAFASYGKIDLPAYAYNTLQCRVGLEHAFTPRFSGSLFAAGEHVTNLRPDSSVALRISPDAEEASTIASLQGRLTYNTTDAPYDPRRGWLLAAFLEPSETENGIRFFRTMAEARRYQSLGKDWVWAVRLKVGGILTDQHLSGIPITRRFYAGGQASVRGYRYGVLGPLSQEGILVGGKGLLELSTELRFPVRGDVSGLLFVDSGNATFKPFAAGRASLFTGVGAGLRFKTPVGPVGLDLAWKLRKTPVDPSRYQLAFFIGYAF
jgi:outer membrane protein assembly complex protein YaeT